MSQRGGRAGNNARNPVNQGNLLNLERIPALSPKFANKLGKTAAGFAVIYSVDGTTVQVQSMLDQNGEKFPPGSPGKDPRVDKVSLVEYERRVALFNRPSADERLSALKRKYELRLGKEFPSKGPASGEEADIQAWLGSISFEERVTLLKSQKDFEKSKSAPNKGS
jgi:hypothetical protein